MIFKSTRHHLPSTREHMLSTWAISNSTFLKMTIKTDSILQILDKVLQVNFIDGIQIYISIHLKCFIYTLVSALRPQMPHLANWETCINASFPQKG